MDKNNINQFKKDISHLDERNYKIYYQYEFISLTWANIVEQSSWNEIFIDRHEIAEAITDYLEKKLGLNK